MSFLLYSTLNRSENLWEIRAVALQMDIMRNFKNLKKLKQQKIKINLNLNFENLLRID